MNLALQPIFGVTHLGYLLAIYHKDITSDIADMSLTLSENGPLTLLPDVNYVTFVYKCECTYFSDVEYRVGAGWVPRRGSERRARGTVRLGAAGLSDGRHPDPWRKGQWKIHFNFKYNLSQLFVSFWKLSVCAHNTINFCRDLLSNSIPTHYFTLQLRKSSRGIPLLHDTVSWK